MVVESGCFSGLPQVNRLGQELRGQNARSSDAASQAITCCDAPHVGDIAGPFFWRLESFPKDTATDVSISDERLRPKVELGPTSQGLTLIHAFFLRDHH